MSRESNQYTVTVSKTYRIMIDKLEEKIEQSEETIRVSCEHIAKEEEKRIKRLEKIKEEISKRRKRSQKEIVTG